MLTINQIFRNFRKKRYRKNRRRALENCPQKKGVCMKILTVTPKKPNSALRKIAKVKLSNQKSIFAHIPGIGHNLQKYSVVIVRGGPVNDIPGMRYRLIRGLEGLAAVNDRIHGRSKYGTKKPKK